MKRLNMLIWASVKAHKIQIFFYCFFVILSTLLVNMSVSLVLPMRENLAEKVFNHVSNREIVTEFRPDEMSKTIEKALNEIGNLEHVEEIYEMPSVVPVTESTGALRDNYQLKFIHVASDLLITSGRVISEEETYVAMIAETIRDFSSSENQYYVIQGDTLIGETLVFADNFGNSYKAVVVGTFSLSDPQYQESDILIPRKDLFQLNAEGADAEDIKTSYIIQTDSYKNTEKVLEKVMDIRSAYRQISLIDSGAYQTAAVILVAALVFFLILTVIVLYLFLKSNIDNRTSELALYRALGYTSKHIYSIVFSEYLALLSISFAASLCLQAVFNHTVVNPFLSRLYDNTLMEMTADFSVPQVVLVAVFYALVLLLTCQRAVRRSEKIDLTVLLKNS